MPLNCCIKAMSEDRVGREAAHDAISNDRQDSGLMNSDGQDQQWTQLEFELDSGEENAAVARAAGDPVYYCEDAYPDEMVREWPDGRKELVRVSYEGKVMRARPYPDEAAAP